MRWLFAWISLTIAFVPLQLAAQASPDCSWVAAGTAPTKPVEAASCQADEATCATALNQCLQPFDFAGSENWWLFTADNGLQPANTPGLNPIHINHQTPQHGLFLSVYVNKVAADAIKKVLAQAQAPSSVDLPAGSVVAKLNYASKAEFASIAKQREEKSQWLTVMAKLDGFCRPTVGGSCNGGNWFYYLSRFGIFLNFAEVTGVNPDGTPIDGGRVSALGQPSAFCTDCHNPVERTDWLWTLDAALWKTDKPELPYPMTMPASGALDPADFCTTGTIALSADLPSDVPLNPMKISAPDLRQAMFDCFSWRSFISLNWSADPEMRGQPDASAPFSALGAERVWESYKETFEVFQPGIKDWKVTPEDWNSRAELPAACQSVVDTLSPADKAALSVPKALQMATKTRANQVLNETHQAFGNQFNILIDQHGRLVRYEVRFNQDEFQYLAENGYADTGNYSYSGPTNGDTVFFPTNANGVTGAGSIEVKAAWRQLCAGEICTPDEKTQFSRHYTRKALKFVPAIGGAPAQCHVLPAVGLIGLHVIRKTETAPQWVWSTFEHVDNVPSVQNTPYASGDWTLFNPACEAALKPSEAFCATQRPGVLPAGKLRELFPHTNPNVADCCANLQLLANAQPGPVKAAATNPTPPVPLLRNHITRLDPIGPQQMNANYAKAIRAADPDSPFQHYVLVNTQWTSGARDPDTGAGRKLSCAQTAFVGRDDAPCYTILPRNSNKPGDSIRLRNTSMETFQVSTNGPGSDNPAHFSSAGCINCHGDAGIDFSFVFTDAIEIDTPE